MKTEQLFFEADAALIDRLGRELVGRQETALIELVKNSYDADARNVTVTLQDNELVVKDDGSGMNREQLIAGFLRLASKFKVEEPTSPIYGRQRAGRKGIGRFATQRLGQILHLQTWSKTAEPGLELVIDWREFQAGRDLRQVPTLLSEVAPGKQGTTLRIQWLRDPWSDAQIRRCWRGLLALQQPFPVAPVDLEPTSDPGFSVGFYRNGGMFADETLVANFQSEILSHLHATIEFRVDAAGKAQWQITRNQFGPDRNWAPIHHEERDSGTPARYQALHNVSMKAHYFILSPELLPSLVYSRVREILRAEGGVRLYRNGFRVVPYGEPGNDWLRLDQIYSKRGPVLAPIANRNFFGVIEVHDPEGKQFEEHTSREGLIESHSFQELTGLATAVLTTGVLRIAEDRGRKQSAGGGTQKKTVEVLNKLKAAASAGRQTEQNNVDAGRPHSSPDSSEPDTSEVFDASTVDLTEVIEFIEQQQAELADEAALLRLLATLGLTMSEFSHETSMTFEAVRMDFQYVFEAALAARGHDQDFAEGADRAKGMLARLDALTAYLNQLASARSIRELSPVSVSKSLKEFERGMQKLAEKASIKLEIDVPAYEPLFTQPMHAAEVSSILLNLFSNSLKALRQTVAPRRIRISAERDGDTHLIIQFSDSGGGIPAEIRDKIFDLFFTTRISAPADAGELEQSSGTGLGLWIVQQIVTKAGGDVHVVDAPNGYGTCIEIRLPAEADDLNG